MNIEKEGDLVLSVATNDLSDVWGVFGKALEEGALPLQQVAFKTKLGVVTRVKNVPVKVLPVSNTAKSQGIGTLYENKMSSMAWFRLPCAELVCFSCDDYDEYKRNFRLQLRAMADSEARLPTDPIPIFVYVQPVHVEDVRGPMRVVDAATKELSDRNFPANSVVHVAKNMFGIQELVNSIKAALAVSIEARCSAYHHETSRIILRLVRDITSPVKSDVAFSDLYLIKDSAAAMLEAAGLYQDAITEYSELDAILDETFARVDNESTPDEDDEPLGSHMVDVVGIHESSHMWNKWHVNRSIISKISGSKHKHPIRKEGKAFIDLVLRPSIYANMIRLLLKDSKRMDALQLCASFIHKQKYLLFRYEDLDQCPINFAASWIFSACISTVMLLCSKTCVEESGNVFFSKELENIDLNRFNCDIDKILVVDHVSFGKMFVQKEEKEAFARILGHLLLLAREMLERVGESNGYQKPSFKPTSHNLLELLKHNNTQPFLGGGPKTPQHASKTDVNRLTPQNSMGADDPRFSGFSNNNNEFGYLAHSKGFSMDNIDLTASNVVPSEDVVPGLLREESDIESSSTNVPSRISIHAREMSDSGSILAHASMASSSPKSDSVPKKMSASNQVEPAAKTMLSLLPDEERMASPSRFLENLIKSDARLEAFLEYQATKYWVLQLHLSSAEMFAHLWKYVTVACRDFFQKSNHHRYSCMLHVDLGDILYLNGAYDEAADIYLAACLELQAQHWNRLLVSVIRRLGCAEARSSSTNIVWTCQLLLKIAYEMHAAGTMGDGPDDSLGLHTDIFLSAAELAEKCIDTPGTNSDKSMRFDMGQCISVDTEKSVGMMIYDMGGLQLKHNNGATCLRSHAGDSVSIEVLIINRTDREMVLDNPSICLTMLQEMNDIHIGMDYPATFSPQMATPRLQVSQSPIYSPRSPNEEAWRPRIVSHWQDIGEIQGELHGMDNVKLVKGVNTVQFLLHPIRSGLYKLQSVDASIHGVDVRFEPSEHQHNSTAQKIILEVEPPAPRFAVKSYSLGSNALISGEEQWLGIQICISRDTVSDASLNIEWPSQAHSPSVPNLLDAHDTHHDLMIQPIGFSALIKDVNMDAGRVIPARLSGDASAPASSYSLELLNDSLLDAIVWWRVKVKQFDVPLEEVRISSYQSRKRTGQDSKMPLSSQHHHHGKRALSMLEIPLSLAYVSRCSRVVSASASLVIDQPFQIHTDAHEIRKGSFVVCLRITSTFQRHVTVRNVSLQCQKGFDLSENLLENSDIVPVELAPSATFCTTFLLTLDPSLLDHRAAAQAMVYRTGKLMPSVALVDYSIGEEVEDAHPYPMGEASQEYTAAVYSAYDHAAGPNQDEHRNLVAGDHDCDSIKQYTYAHKISFQLSSIDSDSYNVFVSVRMLGPFSAHIGSPVTLCWQLERVGACSPESSGASTISYEIIADPSSWARGSGGQGRVTLGLHSGSVATVEAQWTPCSLGTLEVPMLRLHDVYYQEIRETGVKKNVIIVKS